ncbi:MAG TPA: hypothetical protein ENI23_09275 [bacterium]|nr:hypothetical protein [bacterium]
MATVKEEIKFDLKIDEFNLDKEWLNQQNLYFEYASQLAEVRKQLDEAKSQFELVKADLDKAIRTDPQEYGLVKITETVVASTIVLQSEHMIASQAVIEAKYKVAILDAAVNALDNRRKSLENAVVLWVKNYSSKPIAPEGAKEKMDDVEKRDVRTRGHRNRKASRND